MVCVDVFVDYVYSVALPQENIASGRAVTNGARWISRSEDDTFPTLKYF